MQYLDYIWSLQGQWEICFSLYADLSHSMGIVEDGTSWLVLLFGYSGKNRTIESLTATPNLRNLVCRIFGKLGSFDIRRHEGCRYGDLPISGP